jgi:dipeptidyl aminopeptidase/acylaminoacyl peptidase
MITRITAGLACLLAVALAMVPASGRASDVFSPEDVMSTQRAWDLDISPDGKWIAYTVRSNRGPEDPAGSSYRELHVLATRDGSSRPFVTGEVSVLTPRWSPDGTRIAFRSKRDGDEYTQVYVIPVDGGEAGRVTNSKTSVIDFRWHPDGERIVYNATAAKGKREEALKDKGYGFDYFEENLKHRHVYSVRVDERDATARQLTRDMTVWTFEISPDGRTIAVGASEKNLIDHRYAFNKIYLVDFESGEARALSDNPGKLGNFAFSPDGRRVAYAAGLTQGDHAVSQAFVVDIESGKTTNLTPADFSGHINWVGWKDKKTILYRAASGVWNTLNTVGLNGEKHETLLHSRDSGVIFGEPSYTRDFKHFAMVGASPQFPREVFYWSPGRQMRRLTYLNPWIDERRLGRQEVVRYEARDGLEIEGLLIYPVEYRDGTRYALAVVVHGGPESHYTNAWQTTYSRPAQVLAGRGYFVFYPNYRGSTGYGLEFTRDHFNEPAGKEFDDIADGIDFLVGQGLVDRDRVGLNGGSYGGYAAAWFSSYYTEKVRAVTMFVGISNLTSKRGTTDIPYEELYVHSKDKLEKMWQKSLERSPVYHAHKSKTAVLILGGTADTRVHPSQSLEYYRRLKMNDHPAVRYVRYPGEGHGNSKQPGRIDVLYRTLQWYDWYVKDRNPLEGPMPPWDISERYGLDLPEDETKQEKGDKSVPSSVP